MPRRAQVYLTWALGLMAAAAIIFAGWTSTRLGGAMREAAEARRLQAVAERNLETLKADTAIRLSESTTALAKANEATQAVSAAMAAERTAYREWVRGWKAALRDTDKTVDPKRALGLLALLGASYERTPDLADMAAMLDEEFQSLLQWSREHGNDINAADQGRQ